MSFQERLEQVYEELQSENDVEKLVLPNAEIPTLFITLQKMFLATT